MRRELWKYLQLKKLKTGVVYKDRYRNSESDIGRGKNDKDHLSRSHSHSNSNSDSSSGNSRSWHNDNDRDDRDSNNKIDENRILLENKEDNSNLDLNFDDYLHISPNEDDHQSSHLYHEKHEKHENHQNDEENKKTKYYYFPEEYFTTGNIDNTQNIVHAEELSNYRDEKEISDGKIKYTEQNYMLKNPERRVRSDLNSNIEHNFKTEIRPVVKRKVNQNRPPLSFSHIRELYPKFEYTDLASHPAIVILPYQVRLKFYTITKGKYRKAV